MEHVITVKNVSKQFKNFAVKDLNFNIKKGFVTGFIGGNGAGKSTTIKLMMNLLRPDEGEIELFQMKYDEHEKEIKQRIGFVHDANVYYKGLHLKDIRRIVKPAYERWDDELFYHYIDRFNLPLTKSIRHFSKGMQMKASLAVALSHDAELIIMDEPTSGLDPVFRHELIDLLQQIMLDEQRTIFFSTHITSDLERFADYIMFIQQGEIKFQHTQNYLEEHFALVKGNIDLLDRDTEKAFVHVKKTTTNFVGLTNDVSQTKEIFGNNVYLERASLEEIMYYYKGGDVLA